ncbi:MAG: hypothetical protein HPY53_01170 [Brevinematales bacterium]|nr:hypothetical protein [Brevinematales bacterium]
MDDILEVKKNTWKAIESRGIIPAIVLKRLVEDINVSPLFLITGAGPVFVGNEIVFIP